MGSIIVILFAVSIAPFLVAEITLSISDMVRKKSFNDPKKRRKRGIKNSDVFEPKRKNFTLKVKEALHDDRLIRVKDEKKNKWGVTVPPSGGALTWKKLYLILMGTGGIIGILGSVMGQPALMALGISIGLTWVFIAVKQGGEKVKAQKDVFERIFVVLKNHMSIDPAIQPRDIIHIDQWTLPEEPQLIADGRVKAGEEGELEEFNKDIPQPDKKGKVKQPRIARFRTMPVSMTVDFPVTFRESSTDDLLIHLNESFGHKTEWVAEHDVPDPKHEGKTKVESGWDFEHSIAYLRTVPPLPTRAMLPVDFDKGGSWNKIKLGRTVSGEAYWDLKVNPMSLVPLALDTLVWRYDDTANDWSAERLDSLRIGDLLMTGNGTKTKIVSTTPIHTPDDMYRMTFIDESGDTPRMFTVKAAGSHLWPVDMDETVRSMQGGQMGTSLPVQQMSSKQMEEAMRAGVRASLVAVQGNGHLVHWRAYSISCMKPSPVMCVEIDDPTHVFMIASEYADRAGLPKNDDKDTATAQKAVREAITVVSGHYHATDASSALMHSLPTHNCGSPLALDTVLPKYDGTETTMQEVKVGDILIGSNGQPVPVIGLSPVMEADKVYEVELEEVEEK